MIHHSELPPRLWTRPPWCPSVCPPRAQALLRPMEAAKARVDNPRNPHPAPDMSFRARAVPDPVPADLAPGQQMFLSAVEWTRSHLDQIEAVRTTAPPPSGGAGVLKKMAEQASREDDMADWIDLELVAMDREDLELWRRRAEKRARLRQRGAACRKRAKVLREEIEQLKQ